MKIGYLSKITMSVLALTLSHSLFATENQTTSSRKPVPVAPSLGDKPSPYNNPNRFLTQLSFIYWRADVDGIDYALKTSTDVDYSDYVGIQPTNVTYDNSYRQKELKFNWDPGFKAAIGVIFGGKDEWDLVLRWTWLLSKASCEQDSGPATNGTVYASVPDAPISTNTTYQVPGFSPLLLDAPATFSDVNWRLLYNTVDLELGRNFFLANNLTLHAHLGLRGAFLHQHTKVNYQTGLIDEFIVNSTGTPIPGEALGTSQFKGANNYDALGLRGGFDTYWNFVNQFCVYGSLSGAVLFGQFTVDEQFSSFEQLTLTAEPTVAVTSSSSYKNKFNRTRSTVQAALGIMWHTSFFDDSQHFAIRAGYEVNQWFQQNELRSVQDDDLSFQAFRTPGDLGLHGLTIDFIYDF